MQMAVPHQPPRVHPLAYPFLLMLIVGTILPTTGEHGFLQPKTLSFMLASFSTLLHLISCSKLTLRQVMVGLATLIAILFVGLTFSVFILQDALIPISSGIDEGNVFIVTIVACAMTAYWYANNGIPYSLLLKTILAANMVYNLIKLGVVAALFVGVLDVQTYIEFGISTQMTGIGAGLTRLQTSSDVPTPFLLFFALVSSQLSVRLSRPFKWTYLLSAYSCIFLSYSRYQWGIAILAYVFSIALESSLGQVAKRLARCMLTAIVAIAVLGPGTWSEILVNRFISKDALSSDAVRVFQTDALLNSFNERPFIGSGMGSYPEATGDQRGRNFEVQWVSFLMQFGVTGMLVLAALAISIGIGFCRPPMTRVKATMLTIYLLWLLSGFTNPFLISLTSGIMYGLFYITSCMLRMPATRDHRLKAIYKEPSCVF
jgi:hypothetical protein